MNKNRHKPVHRRQLPIINGDNDDDINSDLTGDFHDNMRDTDDDDDMTDDDDETDDDDGNIPVYRNIFQAMTCPWTDEANV